MTVVSHKFYKIHTERENISRPAFRLLVGLTLLRRKEATKENAVELFDLDQKILNRAQISTRMLTTFPSTAWDIKIPRHQDRCIVFDADPEWDAAYERWLSGQTPTDDPLWKRHGVFLSFLT